jgi:hypothetical protein
VLLWWGSKLDQHGLTVGANDKTLLHLLQLLLLRLGCRLQLLQELLLLLLLEQLLLSHCQLLLLLLLDRLSNLQLHGTIGAHDCDGLRQRLLGLSKTWLLCKQELLL